MKTYIAVKEHSLRCPKKNHVLLPYVLTQVKSYLDVLVIVDSEELANICMKFNVPCYMETDSEKLSEFNAIYNYLESEGILNTEDEFIILPVTQPFRSKETILNVVNTRLDNCNVVTTYTEVSNRSIFMLKEDNTFKVDSYNRKGCMCPSEKMADGSIYKMTNKFLKKVVESEDSNHEFWSSKIKFVKNTNPIFLDVDNPIDLEIFKTIVK